MNQIERNYLEVEKKDRNKYKGTKIELERNRKRKKDRKDVTFDAKVQLKNVIFYSQEMHHHYFWHSSC